MRPWTTFATILRPHGVLRRLAVARPRGPRHRGRDDDQQDEEGGRKRRGGGGQADGNAADGDQGRGHAVLLTPIR